jgi:hypothetical protein
MENNSNYMPNLYFFSNSAIEFLSDAKKAFKNIEL